MRVMDEVLENRLLRRWAELLPRPSAQRGGVHESDAELLPLGDGRLLALTIDAVIEEVGVGLYREPFTTGRTAVVSALSDLAAVGAETLGLLLSVTLPNEATAEVQEAVAGGVADACGRAGVPVLGGDTSEGPELAVTVAAAGVVPAGQELTRLGVRPGDRVFLSGPVGSGAALAACRLLDVPESLYREEDYRPPTRLEEGMVLRTIASACMDTSDGLIATLDQLVRLNGVAIRVTRPAQACLHPKADALRRATALPAFPFLASYHGEFELVFTVPNSRVARLHAAAATIGWAPVEVGRVEPGAGLFLGDRSVDGARVRNLLAEVGGDPQAYLHELLAMSPD